MSDTITPVSAADQIRLDVADQIQTVNFTTTVNSDGTQALVSSSTAPSTYLTIDTVAGGSPASDLFLGANFSYIENVNDLSPIIATGADPTQGVLVYQGDSAGQTFYAGTGTEYVAFTGYGNTFAAPTTGTGTYEVSAGLAATATGPEDSTLAAAPTAGTIEGNTFALGAGDASIAGGLGDNTFFLGSGTALIANEGFDTIIGGTGDVTVDGASAMIPDTTPGATAPVSVAGAATVYAGSGTTEYDGGGNSALILGAGGTVNAYGGMGNLTVYGGSGDLSAYGGFGNNVLVSGSGNSTLVGGSGTDQLVASGAGTTTLVAGSGTDTLFAGGASGTTNVFLGSGTDTLVAGTGSEYIQFGSGSSTIFGSTGTDTYGIVNGGPDDTNSSTGTDVVVGFNVSQDFFSLQGFDSTTSASSVLADDVTVSGGSTYLNIPTTGLSVEFYGVTNITAANFVG